ncbi:hypothetical protein KIN20_021748 [Parelaphostrongylus tenuis]|uniref:Uncharacterized protein n=1 Tax=Parelaphostrongylus tenuis TaxID=148309 RepID=A0AAD5MP91_PARTN|nr:hypothetical protein KIN20_021748 [Parelaphostrongylus tenuis]
MKIRSSVNSSSLNRDVTETACFHGLQRKGRVRAQAAGFATSKGTAKAFVERLVVQTVFGVLGQQGRNALLPDAIISSILGQLSIQINYDPLECKGATVNGDLNMIVETKGMTPHCVIVSSMVTATCPQRGAAGNEKVECKVRHGGHGCRSCFLQLNDNFRISHENSLLTTNSIMANWSREMWQSVLNRAVRMLAAGPFSSHFSFASRIVFVTLNQFSPNHQVTARASLRGDESFYSESAIESHRESKVSTHYSGFGSDPDMSRQPILAATINGYVNDIDALHG